MGVAYILSIKEDVSMPVISHFKSLSEIEHIVKAANNNIHTMISWNNGYYSVECEPVRKIDSLLKISNNMHINLTHPKYDKKLSRGYQSHNGYLMSDYLCKPHTISEGFVEYLYQDMKIWI